MLGSLILTKQKRGDTAGCLDVADKYLDDTGNAAVASDFLVTAMTCAEKRAKDDDDPARIKALRERAVARWQALLADDKAPLSVDDRSDAMASLRETLDKLGKQDEAKAIAEQQRTLVDDAAAKATTPLAAMTYNWPRAEVYVYLHRPLELVPALEKSAADLPAEYDPSARLGWLFLKAGKLDEAATTWTDQAARARLRPAQGSPAHPARRHRGGRSRRCDRAQGARPSVRLYESLPAEASQCRKQWKHG